MRFVFKTDYNQDIKLLKHSGYWWSYGVLLAAMIAAPYLVGSYLQSQMVFVFIYAIVGVALIILTGFTGRPPLATPPSSPSVPIPPASCRARAYRSSSISRRPPSSPARRCDGGLPALRLSGIYLVIATIAFAFIVEEILARWESVTHGNEGMRVRTLDLLGQPMPRDSDAFYFLCLLVLVGSILLALNLLRSPTGRAFIAIRDSETAGKSMGIDLAGYKVKSFAISAALTGMAAFCSLTRCPSSRLRCSPCCSRSSSSW